MDWKQYCETNEAITLSSESKKELLHRVKILSKEKEKARISHWKRTFLAAACVFLCALISGALLLQQMPRKSYDDMDYMDALRTPFYYKEAGAYYININSYPKVKKYYEKYYNLPSKITKDMIGEQVAVISEENMKDNFYNPKISCLELYLGKNVYLPKNASDLHFLIVGSGDDYDYFVFKEPALVKTGYPDDFYGPAPNYGAYPDYQDEILLEFSIQRYFAIAGIKNAEDISYIEIAKLDYRPGATGWTGITTLDDTEKKIEDTAFLLQFYSDIRDITPVTQREYEERWDLETRTLEDYEKNTTILTKRMENSCLLRFVTENGTKMELIYHPEMSTLQRDHYYSIPEDVKERLDTELKKVLEN